MAKSLKRKPSFEMRLNAWIYIHERMAEAERQLETDKAYAGALRAN